MFRRHRSSTHRPRSGHDRRGSYRSGAWSPWCHERRCKVLCSAIATTASPGTPLDHTAPWCPATVSGPLRPSHSASATPTISTTAIIVINSFFIILTPPYCCLLFFFTWKLPYIVVSPKSKSYRYIETMPEKSKSLIA